VITLLEASNFRVFGLEITEDDVNRIFEAFARTYTVLREKSPKWRDADFCKAQLVGLWENISSLMNRIDLEERRQVDSEYLATHLHLNTENEEFLRLLGKISEGALWLLSRFEETRAETGSIHLNFRDPKTNQRQHVVLDPRKIRRQMQKYTSKVANALRQFVDWVLENKRTVVTCVLVAGVVTITVFAGLWVGAPAIHLAKLLIPLAIAIICLVAEAASTYGEFDRFLRSLRLRGITLL